MKKHVIYFLFFFLMYSYCNAQDSLALVKSKTISSKYSISFAVGLSPGFGLYSFDDETGNYSTGAFAAPGMDAKINFDYPFKSHKLELTGTLGYIHNAYDISNYLSYEYLTNSEILTNAYATSYDIFSFLAGVKYPIRKGKFTFSGELTAGFLICHTPSISYIVQNATPNYGYPGTWNETQSSGTGSSIALNLGIGIEYNICKNIFFMISANRFISTPSVVVSSTTTEQFNPPSQTINLTIPIVISSLELGAGFEF